jgi:[acyl-carrier-protein] S-malonyltransferase
MLAYVFPGQGAQAVGAGKDIAERWSGARRTFEEADDALGYAISKLCFEGPAEELRLTRNAQPAVMTVSVAILRVLEQETDLAPEIVTGHSLGEYSALVCAKAFTFAAAVRLVHKRGLFMQEAVAEGQGAMAAIMGAGVEQVDAWCAEVADGEVVTPSNYNGPSQIVVAGHAGAVQRVVGRAEAEGAVAKLLEVSAPFHCSLMEPAARRLAEELESIEIGRPAIPVVSNVDARTHEDIGAVRRRLVQQVTTPVYWEQCVRKLVDEGVREVIEVGCGRTLSGLIRRIERRKLTLRNTATAEDVAALVRSASPGLSGLG